MLAGAKDKGGDGQFIVGKISFLTSLTAGDAVAFKELRVGDLVTR